MYNKFNSRKFILDKILNFQNKVIEKEENYFDNLINYKTEKIFKYLVKKNKNIIPKFNRILARCFFCRIYKNNRFQNCTLNQSFKKFRK